LWSNEGCGFVKLHCITCLYHLVGKHSTVMAKLQYCEMHVKVCQWEGQWRPNIGSTVNCYLQLQAVHLFDLWLGSFVSYSWRSSWWFSWRGGYWLAGYCSLGIPCSKRGRGSHMVEPPTLHSVKRVWEVQTSITAIAILSV